MRRVTNKKLKLKDKMKLIIIIFIITILLLTFSIYLRITKTDSQGNIKFPIIDTYINETQNNWNVIILNFTDINHENRFENFEYTLVFTNEDVTYYKESNTFNELLINNSEYIMIIDNDNNHLLNENDVIIINKYFNDNNTLFIDIEIGHYSTKYHRYITLLIFNKNYSGKVIINK